MAIPKGPRSRGKVAVPKRRRGQGATGAASSATYDKATGTTTINPTTYTYGRGGKKRGKRK